MIFLTSRYHSYTFRDWLALPRGDGIRDQIQLVYYQELNRLRRLPATTYVFADLERLGPAQKELAVRLWETLESSGRPVRLLNDPRRVLTRYPLLTELHGRGWNRFRALRATGPLDDLRYPVFVREEREHTGPLSSLLHDRASLERALRRLTNPLRGFRRSELLVIEFCDVSDQDGVFHKYAAFRVGDRIIARYLEFSTHWTVKATSRIWDEERIETDLAFVRANPHEHLLRPIFDAAAIEYGRIDYAMVDGQPQVWEINTNPTVGRTRWNIGRNNYGGQDLQPLLAPSRKTFHGNMREAIIELGLEDATGEPIPFTVPWGLSIRVWAEWSAMNLPVLYREILRLPKYARLAIFGRR